MTNSSTGALHSGTHVCGQQNDYPHDLPSYIFLRVNLAAPLTDGNMLPWRIYTMVAKEMSFSIGKILRCDTYAKIMLARSTANNKKIAVKCIQKGCPKLKSYLKYILPRESRLLQMLRGHPNVVRFIGLVETDKYVILATEYIEGTNLLEYSKLKGKLDEDEARVIFKDLLNAVATCHSLGICIRGITCENVLLDNNLIPIISNFEHAIVQGYDKIDIFQGTPYSPPEVFHNEENNPQLVDVWTLGIVLYTMVTGIHPFEMKSALHSQKMSLSFPGRISKACYNIIKKMLQVSPIKRIKISELKRDIWLNNVALRYIDYQLTENSFRNEKACITHSFSAEITMNNKQSRGEHWLDSDDIDSLEICHKISKPISKRPKSKKPLKTKKRKDKPVVIMEEIEKSVAVKEEDKEPIVVEVKEEEYETVDLEFISSLIRDSASGQSLHEYYSFICDLMDDDPVKVRSYKYKDAEVNTIDQKNKKKDEVVKKSRNVAVNTTEVNIIDQLSPPEPHTTQYLMVIAPPTIEKKGSKTNFFHRRHKRTTTYNYPSTVDIDNQGSDVKLTLTIDDGQQKEFTFKAGQSSEPGDLKLTSSTDFGEGSYTIQQMTGPDNADNTGTPKLLGATEIDDRKRFLNALSRALPRKRTKSLE